MAPNQVPKTGIVQICPLFWNSYTFFKPSDCLQRFSFQCSKSSRMEQCKCTLIKKRMGLNLGILGQKSRTNSERYALPLLLLSSSSFDHSILWGKNSSIGFNVLQTIRREFYRFLEGRKSVREREREGECVCVRERERERKQKRGLNLH